MHNLYVYIMKLHDIAYSQPVCVLYHYDGGYAKVYRPNFTRFIEHDVGILGELKGSNITHELRGCRTLKMPWWDQRSYAPAILLSPVTPKKNALDDLLNRYDVPSYALLPHNFVDGTFIGTQYLLRYP